MDALELAIFTTQFGVAKASPRQPAQAYVQKMHLSPDCLTWAFSFSKRPWPDGSAAPPLTVSRLTTDPCRARLHSCHTAS